MPASLRADFSPLTGGNGVSLIPALAFPNLGSRGYVEEELQATGTAASYGGHPDAAYATRVAVRRPASGRRSGTLVVEWINVSSGQDATPDWNYLAEEIVRQGHTWAGVSAQYNGVHGGEAAVATGVEARGLTMIDPERYGDLAHPGDAYCLDLFTQVARGLAADTGADCVLAVGESQSAFALTSYVDQVREHPFGGFLVHSRSRAGLPPGEPGRGVDLTSLADQSVVRFRDDVEVPVVIVQTEGDLFGRLNFLPARQPDSTNLRLWEIAGAAHADLFQIGEFESFLGCPDPVNRGQQAYVVRAALRWLEGWARGGPAAPSAPLLEVDGDRFVLDDNGNVRGGVRTPVVDAPVQVLSGIAAPDASLICALFGRTLAMDPARVAALYSSPEAYLAAYETATDAAIAAGFVLAEDRDAVLAEARPDLV